jgi:hypothetical protein
MRALLLRLLLAPRKRSKSRPHACPFILHSSLLLVPAPHASICVCAYNMRKMNYTYIHVVPIFVYTHTHTLTLAHSHARTRAHARTHMHLQARGTLRVKAPGPHDHSGTRTNSSLRTRTTVHTDVQVKWRGRRRSGGDAPSSRAESTEVSASVPTRLPLAPRPAVDNHQHQRANECQKECGREHLLPRRLAVRVCPSCSACLCLCGDWHRCSLYIGERASRARVPRLK